ncbi:hypothetical protein [Clostridium sp. AF32-12BH]|uniref:hypothetical protein n=1 Tax=Clostridium sp. AF32-12BH TaxID=2292006 RepID=UPI000E50E62C|nr:hypothetical protein [Clostridium sp. AF32-12BH]RHP46406.1 hypothetical protein DWZ40_10225 [Clostridium sp. AF32-12BH]
MELKLNLRMFDGEGAAGAAGTGGAEGTAGTENAAATEGAAGENQSTEPEETPEERQAKYKEFKEKYKDLYGADVKKQIDRRFAPMNRMQEQLDAHEPLMQMLSARYGTDATDVKGIMAAIEADDAYYEQKALEAGMPVEQYKEFVRLKAENKAFEEAQNRAENLRQEQDTWRRWDEEAEKCKSLYPDFDIRTEISTNKDFVRMLGAGCDVTTAYQAAHFNDITQSLIARSEKETKKRAAETVRSGASRPVEGASGSSQAAKGQRNIAAMSRAEFEEFRRKVLSGEETL